MDFGTLLHMAKKNSESSKQKGKYYSTKFAPPKKESKESKQLSENIQRFLHKQEQEERIRQREKKDKLNSLLAMRDEKSKNKIRKMLKVTKSANKSVLDDARDTDHTAVTMQGPEQPDQDDYGYVSNAANDFYAKYMEKVKDVKEDKGFAPSRPQSLRDLSGTKERVKAAITKEIEDKKNPTRQRSSTTATSSTVSVRDATNSIARAYTSSKTLYDPQAERREEELKKREEEQQRAKKRKPQPPPLDFQALLKLAEKKQHEPIEIVPEVKVREPERLLTLKEKRELMERECVKEAREERREKEKCRSSESKERKDVSSASGTARMEPNGRIPKLSQTAAKFAPINKGNVSNTISKKSNPSVTLSISTSASAISASKTSNGLQTKSVHQKPLPNSKPGNAAATTVTAIKLSTSASALNISKTPSNNNGTIKNRNNHNGSIREFPPRETKSIKPKQLPPPDVQKTRQFPPPDVRRNGTSSSHIPVNRKPTAAFKRRILDDDEEDDYDSEMDDFIDDGDCEDDYSTHIKAIFGYDKSKYGDEDEDDANMESNFAQVQREEYISKKIGLQEDLEDMKLEAMEKKRKMHQKKRRLN